MKPVAASGKVAQKPCPAVLIWCQTEEAPRRVAGFGAAHRERYAEEWGNTLRPIDAKAPGTDAETCDKRTPNVWNTAALWSKGTKTAYEGLRDS